MWYWLERFSQNYAICVYAYFLFSVACANPFESPQGIDLFITIEDISITRAVPLSYVPINIDCGNAKGVTALEFKIYLDPKVAYINSFTTHLSINPEALAYFEYDERGFYTFYIQSENAYEGSGYLGNFQLVAVGAPGTVSSMKVHNFKVTSAQPLKVSAIVGDVRIVEGNE